MVNPAYAYLFIGGPMDGERRALHHPTNVIVTQEIDSKAFTGLVNADQEPKISQHFYNRTSIYDQIDDRAIPVYVHQDLNKSAIRMLIEGYNPKKPPSS